MMRDAHVTLAHSITAQFLCFRIRYTSTGPRSRRMIRTIREELLDQVLFWNQLDLERKLSAFRGYYNQYRVHGGIEGIPPDEQGGQCQRGILPLSDFGWRSHCHGLFQLPTAA